MRDCSGLLGRLAALVASGDLMSPVGHEMPWGQIDDAAQRLTAQSVDGKIILNVN